MGGLLVGQDLIRASGERNQISQIAKYNQAVNTFRDKFDFLPGDMPAIAANQFGFTVGAGCNGAQGSRDGNGLLDGGAFPNIGSQGIGETALFWQDLSSAKFIPEAIPNSGFGLLGCSGCPAVVTADLPKIFPAAATSGDFVSVYENNGVNWFGVSGINKIVTCANPVGGGIGMTVIQAYNIDRKIDDGVPTTGNVQATGMGQTGLGQAYNTWGPDPLQCFYSNPVNAPPGGVYSISAATGGNNSNRANCILSFKFQ